MNKAALPLYILLVTGWLACILTDSNLTRMISTPCISIAVTTNPENHGKAIRLPAIMVLPAGNVAACIYYKTAVAAANTIYIIPHSFYRGTSFNTKKNYGNNATVSIN